jgi:hypothetical protein
VFAFLIAREVSLFTEADFEEHQEQASRESGGDQDDREDFAGHSPDQRRTRTACEDKGGGRPKRHDAHPGGHAFTVSANQPTRAPGTEHVR